MRILGLDYGERTIGVAVSDGFGWTAQALEVIKRSNSTEYKKSISRIAQWVEEYEVNTIVLGYPKNMDNTEGERCEKTREFKAHLERRTGLPVELWDERLTTAAADNIMTESRIFGRKRKEYVDEIAAMLILQGYLDFFNMNKE